MIRVEELVYIFAHYRTFVQFRSLFFLSTHSPDCHISHLCGVNPPLPQGPEKMGKSDPPKFLVFSALTHLASNCFVFNSLGSANGPLPMKRGDVTH